MTAGDDPRADVMRAYTRRAPIAGSPPVNLDAGRLWDCAAWGHCVHMLGSTGTAFCCRCDTDTPIEDDDA